MARVKNRLLLGILCCSLFAAAGIAQTNKSTRSALAISTPLVLGMRQPKPLSREEERALRPLDMFQECVVCPEMIVIPAGEFIMGAPESEQGSEDNERPQHKVTFAAAFAVGRFALTFAEWDACVAEGGCRNYKPPDKGWGRGRQPVINLWWDDARAYVRWLSERTRRSYRLLSEAEREYVTRAGTTTPFWWGSSPSTDQANYDGSFTYPFHAGGSKGEFRKKTAPVDSFAPNPWGLYQVHGNVFEWVEDCWHGDYIGAPIDGSPWNDVDCDRHVLRGGSWDFPPSHLRSADRGAVASAVNLVPVGMRIARTLPGQSWDRMSQNSR